MLLIPDGSHLEVRILAGWRRSYPGKQESRPVLLNRKIKLHEKERTMFKSSAAAHLDTLVKSFMIGCPCSLEL
jgi:hypothetical protein